MRKENQNVNICSRKGITLVELVVSMTLVALFSVVCVSLINPIERIYQHTVKLSHAQLIADTVVDSIRKECTDVDNSDEGSVWIAKKGVSDVDDSKLSDGPYATPETQGPILVMRKNGNYCEAIFSCFKITEENLLALEKTGMTGTSFSHAASSLSDEKNKANLNSGYVHFGYYQVKDNSKGVTPDISKIYDYTNPITASTYEGYTVSLSFENLQYKEDENHVKHPTFVELTVNVFDGNYTDGESKRIYSRKTVISFSPNGSGKGTNAGSGGGTHSSKKNIDIRVRWVDENGNVTGWPDNSIVSSIDITYNGSNPARTYTLANGLSRFVFANVEVTGSGSDTLTCSDVDDFSYTYTGSADKGFVVTYKHDVKTVKLVCGKTFSSKFIGSGDQKKVTGIVFGKKSDWVGKINNFKANGAKVSGPTPVAVPYYDPSDSEDYKDDYVLYKVTSNGEMTVYVLSKDGRFVLNESCEKMFINIENLKSITGFTGPEDVNSIFSTELTTSMRCMFEGCKKISTFELAGLVSSKVSNTYGMFKNCTGVVRYDFSEWDTSGITNMSYMFNNFQMTNLDFTLDISNFRFNQTQNIDMSFMFDHCGAANVVFPSSISNSAGKVSTIEGMFQNCTKLKSIDGFMINAESSDVASAANVKELKFSGVTNANNLFNGCASLKNVRLRISLPSCEHITQLFAHCDSLVSMDLSKSDFSGMKTLTNFFWYCNNMEKVKMNEVSLAAFTGSSTQMFEQCYGLKWLELKDSDLRAVTNARFFTRDSLEHLDISRTKLWSMTTCEDMFKVIRDTNEKHLISVVMKDTELNTCTNYKNMFKNCHYLTSVEFSPKSSAAVTAIDCTGMFRNCYALTSTSVDFSEWDKSKVSNMSYFFQNCTGLNSYIFNGITVNNCTDISYMFNGCTALTTVSMSGFTAQNLTNCQGMFEGCTNLDIGADNFKNWDISKVTNLSYLFKNCQKMGNSSNGVVSLSNMDFSSCTTMQGAFEGCLSMKTLEMDTVDLKSCNTYTDFIKNCSELDTVQITNSDLTALTGLKFLNKIPTLDFSGSTIGASSLESSFANSSGSEVVTVSFAGTKLPNCTSVKQLFSGCSTLTSADFTGLDAPKLSNCSMMFQNCTGLTNYTFTNVTLDACTTVEGMFSGCTNLSAVYMSGLTTPVLTNCSKMFQNCSQLDVGAGNFAGWDTASVTNMSYMFSNCVNMGHDSEGVVRLAYMNLSSCTSMQNAFEGCTSMTTLKLDHIDFEICNNFSNLYSGCLDFTCIEMTNSNLVGIKNLGFLFGAKNIDLSGSTLGFAELKSTFANQNIESFILNGTHFPYCKSFFQFFSGCQNLTKVEMIGLDVPVLNNCGSMFLNCHALRTLDMSGCDTSSVTNMSYMFSGCSVLSFDSSGWDGWDTSNVTNMSYMFKDCCYDYQKSNDPALRTAEYTINISNFSFESVTDMKYMLSCGTIKNEDYKYDILDTIIMPDGTNDNGNASEVTNIMYMFMWRNNTTEIRNLEHFKTSGKLKYARSMFSYVNCTVLDIRGLNFVSLANSDDGSSWIFDNCKSLVTVYADPNKNYIPSKGQGFFNFCESIKGGAGTTFIGNDKKYAKIDGGTDNEGYFTDYHVRTA